MPHAHSSTAVAPATYAGRPLSMLTATTTTPAPEQAKQSQAKPLEHAWLQWLANTAKHAKETAAECVHTHAQYMAVMKGRQGESANTKCALFRQEEWLHLSTPRAQPRCQVEAAVRLGTKHVRIGRLSSSSWASCPLQPARSRRSHLRPASPGTAEILGSATFRDPDRRPQELQVPLSNAVLFFLHTPF